MDYGRPAAAGPLLKTALPQCQLITGRYQLGEFVSAYFVFRPPFFSRIVRQQLPQIKPYYKNFKY